MLASQDDGAAGARSCYPPCLLRPSAGCERKRSPQEHAYTPNAMLDLVLFDEYSGRLRALGAVCDRMVSLWLMLGAWWARRWCGACMRIVQEPSRTAASTQMTASAMSQGHGPAAKHLVSPRALHTQITRTAATPAAIATMGSATSQVIAELGLTVVTVGTAARTPPGHHRHHHLHPQAEAAAPAATVAATVATIQNHHPPPQQHHTAQVSQLHPSATPCALAIV